MDSKKFSVFALFMVIVMCCFSIYVGMSTRGEDGVDGKDGLSSYELAIKNGLISKDVTEKQYLQSLNGEDGTSVTLNDIYKQYLKSSGKTEEDLSYTDFILTYYPEKIISDESYVSMVENATQNALRSTVDICYSFYMDTPIIVGYFDDEENDKFIIDSSYVNQYVVYGVSAGSGVIYDYEDTDSDGENDVAYIVTNYHVVYCSNYSNNEDYYAYYNESTKSYFTATYDDSKLQKYSEKVPTFWGYSLQSYNYINSSDMEIAPNYTHFLDNYGIYLYGYQDEKYEISATFVGGSAENDIAVLKVTRDENNKNNDLIFEDSFKSVDLGESSSLVEGETIVAVGNPLLADTSKVNSSEGVSAYVESAKQAYIEALCLTSTSGEVSNISEYCLFESLLDSNDTINMRLIRVSSAINAGNSGGGLYSASGKLVGIVNGKIASENYDNVGYAIPIDVVVRVVNQVIAQCDNDDVSKVRITAVTTEKLGITVEKSECKSYYDSNKLCWVNDNDIEISSVTNETLGLMVSDIIKSIVIGEKTYDINNVYDVNDALLMVRTTDSTVRFVVIRDGNEVTVDAPLTRSNFVEIL